MGGGYSQGYQGRPQSNWGNQGGAPVQPTYGDYGQEGGYPAPPGQYNTQASYGGYPPQPPSGGYAPSWDPSNQGQQAAQGAGYDYYSQQNQLQPQAQGDNTGYNYNQQPSSGYGQQGQGYSQDAYSGGYAYGQQQQSYNSASYGGPAANTSEGQNTTYGAQSDGTQAPPPGQQGYGTNQQPNSGNSASLTAAPDANYSVPPNPGYGSQPGLQSSYGQSYGTPQGQKPTSTPPAYGQSQQQSPNTQGGYAQAGYALPPPPPPAGYNQADAGSQKVATPAYYAHAPGGQATYAAQPAYGSAPGTQPGYGQQPPYNGAYGSAYSQPPAYASTETDRSSNATVPQTSAAAASTKAGGEASPHT